MDQGGGQAPAVVIDWSTPPDTKPDWLFGAGATRQERWLVWAGSLIGLAYVGWQWSADEPGDWRVWQYLLAALVALDLTGGAVSNVASSTKRQYFGPYTGPVTTTSRVARNPIVFASLHVYPFIIVGLFPGGRWWWALAMYLGVLAAVLVLDRLTPLYLQRPVAMLMFVAVILLSTAFSAPPGWAWFPAIYFAKLVLGHAVREEPYRPAPGT